MEIVLIIAAVLLIVAIVLVWRWVRYVNIEIEKMERTFPMSSSEYE